MPEKESTALRDIGSDRETISAARAVSGEFGSHPDLFFLLVLILVALFFALSYFVSGAFEEDPPLHQIPGYLELFKS